MWYLPLSSDGNDSGPREISTECKVQRTSLHIPYLHTTHTHTNTHKLSNKVCKLVT